MGTTPHSSNPGISRNKSAFFVVALCAGFWSLFHLSNDEGEQFTDQFGGLRLWHYTDTALVSGSIR